MNRFIVAEASKCIGCRTCEVACVLAHAGPDGLSVLSAQTFAPRLKVVKSTAVSVPVTCRHCEDAPCANACPNAAIVYRENSVQVLQERCVGCKSCAVACPFGAMEIVNVPAMQTYGSVTIGHGVKAEAQKCDLCAGRTQGQACVTVCPTKALHVFDAAAMELTLRRRQERAALEAVKAPLLIETGLSRKESLNMEKVITVCPYCGSGCKINLLVDNGKVVGAEAADGVTNQGELCLKGYYGWDFLNDTKLLTPRLKRPMIRRQRGGEFEAVSWDEAIAFASSRLKAIKEKHGPDSIMVTGSSRGTGNESNYVAQKFARAVIGTNNIDCCARVCHGPSVSGLMATLGNGAMSNSICEIEDTQCILVFGYNAADSHPIVARRILKAKEKGAKIIVCDPRCIETARIADLFLPLKNGSNMALVNAFANVLLNEGLYNKEFVANYSEGLEEYKAMVAKYTPEYVESITGLSPQLIREAIRMYAAAPSATILWGMGVTQWGQAVDVVKGLSSLATITGNLGRPNVGVGPVRGQNNVQGACDMGTLPNTLPGYYPVTDAAARAKFAKAWGVPSIPEKIGFGLTDVPHKIAEGKLKANYIFGEDPLQTEPDLGMMRREFEKLELIIVQDIFMTKTAMVADVIFPATSWGEHENVFSSADRGFQRCYKAIDPPADYDVKHDWEIHSLMATAMGYPMHYNNAQEIWDELRGLCHLYTGATYEKMAGLGYVPWPCPTEDHPGTPWLYEGKKFDTPSGKAQLFAAEWRAPLEKVDADYPLGLCTVREVGHYSCRSMTGNCSALQTLADEPGFVQIHPDDAKTYGIADQSLVWVSSRRGKVITRANHNDRVNKGAVYMTYQWWIGACNELTVDHLDPISKTPEYKFSAVKVEGIADQVWAENHVQQVYGKMKADMRKAALA